MAADKVRVAAACRDRVVKRAAAAARQAAASPAPASASKRAVAKRAQAAAWAAGPAARAGVAERGVWRLLTHCRSLLAAVRAASAGPPESLVCTKVKKSEKKKKKKKKKKKCRLTTQAVRRRTSPLSGATAVVTFLRLLACNVRRSRPLAGCCRAHCSRRLQTFEISLRFDRQYAQIAQSKSAKIDELEPVCVHFIPLLSSFLPCRFRTTRAACSCTEFRRSNQHFHLFVCVFVFIVGHR